MSDGADRFGFDPFPGYQRFTGYDFIPGYFQAWTPSEAQWGLAPWRPVGYQILPNRALPTRQNIP